MEDINVLIERGRIVNKFKPDTNVPLVILTLSVPTLDKKIPNYPKILFWEDSAIEADKFNIHDYVEITGLIQSKRKMINDKKVNSQSLVGITIKESNRTMDSAFEGITGGNYLAPENTVKLKGKIRNITKASSNVSSIIVDVVTDNRHSFVRCFAYNSTAETLLTSFEVGMEVACIGEIQTLKKPKDDSCIYFENVVIREITKI